MQHKELIKPNAAWIELLWGAMLAKGKGYRKFKTTGHTGRGKDRRQDKLEGPNAGKSKFARSYYYRYCVN